MTQPEPQLKLQATEPEESSGYKWSELNHYERNTRYTGPDGNIAALLFAEGGIWHGFLMRPGRALPLAKLGPFDNLEAAQGYAETEAKRLNLLQHIQDNRIDDKTLRLLLKDLRANTEDVAFRLLRRYVP